MSRIILVLLLVLLLASSASAAQEHLVYLPVVSTPCEPYCTFEFLWPDELQSGDMADYLVNYRETFLVCWHEAKFCQLMFAEELASGDPTPKFP